MKTFEEVRDVIKALQDCRIDGDDIILGVDEGEVVIEINCSDVFWWGTADGEPIEAEDIDILRSSYADLKALPPKEGEDMAIWYIHTNILFCARKRKMRPQGKMYDYLGKETWHLFNACGPHRPSKFGNPYETPEVPT